MQRRVLFRARQLCVGAPDLAPPARLADLAGVPFLGFSAEMTLSAFGPMGAESVTLRPRRLANDPRTLARAAAAGAGFAILPAVVMADLLQAGALVPVLPDHRLEAVDVNLISHGRTRDTPAVALLAEFLAAETAGLGDAGQGFQPA